jgi:hypothetical protein
MVTYISVTNLHFTLFYEKHLRMMSRSTPLIMVALSLRYVVDQA